MCHYFATTSIKLNFYSDIVIIIFAIDEDNEIEDKFEWMAKDSKKDTAPSAVIVKLPSVNGNLSRP